MSLSHLSTMNHFESHVGFHVFMTDNASITAVVVSSYSTDDATAS